METKIIFEDFEKQLANLNELIQDKALEIANERFREEDITKEQAIQKGIALAKEWWMNIEG